MALVKVLRAGQVTLPAEARKALKLAEGDYLEAEVVADGLLLRPVAVVERERAWNDVFEAIASVRPTPEQARKPIARQEEEIVEEIKAARREEHAKRRP